MSTSPHFPKKRLLYLLAPSFSPSLLLTRATLRWRRHKNWCNESEGHHRRTRIVPHCATKRETGLARTKLEIYLRIQFLPHSKHMTYPLKRKFGWGNNRDVFREKLMKHTNKICGQKRHPEFWIWWYIE